MESIGVVRYLDSFGRVVIPSEVRKTHRLEREDPIEIFVEGERIILKKYMPICIFCGESKGLTICKERNVCKSCFEKLKVLSEIL